MVEVDAHGKNQRSARVEELSPHTKNTENTTVKSLGVYCSAILSKYLRVLSYETECEFFEL